MRIAVVGAAGQLAAAVSAEARRRGHQVLPFTRADFDLTDHARTAGRLIESAPDVIVNGAAYNAVDDAETNAAQAFAVNATAVRLLASVARDVNAAFVHYGSDFVFDGHADSPYDENAAPNPLSIYGHSKLAGEMAAMLAPRHYVLRVASIFGHAGAAAPARGTIVNLIRALLRGDAPRAFSDRVVTPTSILDAARATMTLVENGSNPGLYHCVSSGPCTWFELATYLAETLGVAARPVPVPSASVVLPAARPRYAALANEKLRASGIALPTWQASLQDAIDAVGVRNVG